MRFRDAGQADSKAAPRPIQGKCGVVTQFELHQGESTG